MSEELAAILDLQLAWRRVKADIIELKRVFVRNPYEIKLIEQNLGNWLNSLMEAVSNNVYNPAPMHICDVPKEKGLIRPGSQLSLSDQIVYAACLSACLPYIHKAIFWAQGTVDFSYRLAIEPNNPVWFRNRFEGWEEFRKNSLAKIDEGISYVVIADISGYYENIDINLLVSDLRNTYAPAPAISQLSNCLNRWSQIVIGGRGIPQGLSASDILGKLYLTPIDLHLKQLGFIHYRYVDDIRIFCHNLAEAKKALVTLIRLLRRRGLNLQAAKTNIYRADDARVIIEGVADTIGRVSKKYIDDIIKITGVDDPYTSISKVEKEYELNPDEAPIEIIRETYKAYFMDIDDSTFEKSLFKFMLNRLGKRKDKYAVEHCKQLFVKHPEVTDIILDYYGLCEVYQDIESAIIEFLDSEEAVYPYQIYQIIEWISGLPVNPSESLIEIARRLAFDYSKPYYLRFICLKLLGDFGNSADLERIEDSYGNARSPLEQSVIICCLKRMEKGRRNAFLGRAEKDGDLNMRAARFVKSLTL
jgi:hypothetical protein